MRRSAAEIDVAAVRFVVDDDRLDAEAREQPRRHRRRRAVRAVDGELERAERGDFGKHDAEVTEIRLDALHRRQWTRVADGRQPGLVRHDGFDVPLHLFGELLACAREHLDAVVFERIMGRRDDDADVVAGRSCEVGDSGRRHDAGARDARAFA